MNPDEFIAVPGQPLEPKAFLKSFIPLKPKMKLFQKTG
jgi:hypothetical protein